MTDISGYISRCSHTVSHISSGLSHSLGKLKSKIVLFVVCLQYASVQMSDMGTSLPDSHHPVQRKSRPSSQPTPATAQSQVECVYENGSGMRSRPISDVSSGDVVPLHRHSANHAVAQHRTAEEEVSPLVYASLNHQVATRSHTRPLMVKEESTEYAAIRLS